MSGFCKRHGERLVKTRNPLTGETVFSCPRMKCTYKEDKEGEKT